MNAPSSWFLVHDTPILSLVGVRPPFPLHCTLGGRNGLLGPLDQNRLPSQDFVICTSVSPVLGDVFGTWKVVSIY